MADLCISCNLCCNGSIFARVPVTPEEQSRLPEGMQFLVRKGKLRMRLPCPSLCANGACGCYEERPAVCRTYFCKLRKKTNAGEISDAKAGEILKVIKQSQARAVQLATEALGKPRDYYPPSKISRAFRRLNKSLESKSVTKGFVARRALIEHERYIELVRLHLQSNYKG